MATEVATFGGGCFWCTEAVFQYVRGVVSVEPGYSGGDMGAPTYEQVSQGDTGHAEAIQVTFDPGVISFHRLLDVFWATHDPTTLNQQGGDVGTQYRSVIFTHTPEQEKIAEESKQELQDSGKYDDDIVTQIVPFTSFYPAEEYHKDFYKKNTANPYCQAIIDPKITKLFKEFPDETVSDV